MTISEFLTAVRTPYIATFARVATHVVSHVEPAYRQSDGSLAVEGALGLPCRVDVIPMEGITAGQTIRVDSETRLKFEAVTFASGAGEVVLSPFVWDWTPLEVLGLSQEAVSNVIQPWFLKWFDTDDENVPTEDGLFGVVHFMSELERTKEGWRVTVDLGSSPVNAVEDFLFRMLDAGAYQVRVG
ncbi:hypothetical protein [Janthinobacterium sp. HLS12-2]|uniref:hypothetical protein n=1 Tax=Janthinobacterium sp. HLS12-2 TaxID=1259324 RepID=UPI003F28D84A